MAACRDERERCSRAVNLSLGDVCESCSEEGQIAQMQVDVNDAGEMEVEAGWEITMA